MGGDAADEQTSRIFVQSCGTSQEAREKGTERGQRDEAASVFQHEFSGEISVASLDAGAVFVHGKVPENIVVVETPARAVRTWR